MRLSARSGWASRCKTASRTSQNGWRRSGHDLGFAIGIAQGYATLGRVGFEGRFDYAAIGTVTNLAARLCDVASAGQMLVSQRVHAAVEDLVVSTEVKRTPAERLFATDHCVFDRRPRRRSRRHVSELAAEPLTLRSLTEREREQRFEALQRKLHVAWDAMRLNLAGESIVVVPSVTLDRVVDRRAPVQAYEERFLFLLLLLRQPRLQLIYVTSTEIDPTVIEYYLALLPGVIPSHARARLHLVAAHDASPTPLTAKVLERPRLIERIRALIPDRSLSHLVAYNVTSLERDLALALGIPLFGADPRHLPLGTKSGCRRLFAEEGVPHPIGYEDVDGLDSLLAYGRSAPRGTAAGRERRS